MSRVFIAFLLLFCVILLSACTVSPQKVSKKQVAQLSDLLYQINPQSTLSERRQISLSIFYKTQELTKEFSLTSPPLWHNFLVNTGVREKGLCYHWSDALYVYLHQRHYAYFSFHLVGANVGEYFREHNALIVVSKGQEPKDGIIIDPWRNSGKLYFSKVNKDTKYTWVHRVDRACP